MGKMVLILFALTAQLSAAPVRIMPLGDSITAGYTSGKEWKVPFEFGYRSRLYTLLTKAGYEFQFVGDSPEPFNNKFGDPTQGGTVAPTLDLRAIQQNGHRGYGGASIVSLNGAIAKFMAADNPDIILLMIGINGIRPESSALLDALVDNIFKAKPDVKLIVAQITPKAAFNQDLYNYNTFIRDTLVPKYSGLGKSIATVNQYEHFLKDPADPKSINRALLSNGINHPDTATYALMAETWFAGINAMLPAAKAKDAAPKKNSQ